VANPIVGRGDDRTVLPLHSSGSTNLAWRGTTSITARTFEAPTITVTSTESGLTLDLQTAATNGLSKPVVLFNMRPGSWQLPTTVPAVVSSAWLDETNTGLGEQLHFEGLPVRHGEAVVVGSLPLVPTIDPASQRAVIMDLATVQLHDYQAGRPLLSADEYWIATTESADPADVVSVLSELPFDSVELSDRDAKYRGLTADPAALATIGAFTVGFVAAAVFAVLVFIATTTVSARQRRSEFTLLRAFGLTPRQYVRWAATERLLLVAAGAVLGSGVGLLLSATVLPLISVGRQGSVAVPGVQVHYPWLTIAAVVATPVAALVVVVLSIAVRPERESLGSRIRDGER